MEFSSSGTRGLGFSSGKFVSGAPSDYHAVTVEIFDRFLPSYWWTDPTDAIDGPLWAAFAMLMTLAFMAGVVAWLLAPRLAPVNRLHRRLIVRAAQWTVGLSSVGLFLLLFRWQMTPFLSKRLWLFVWLGVVVGVGALAERYRRREYPADLSDWQDEARIKRYLPKSRSSGSRSGGSRSHRRPRRRR